MSAEDYIAIQQLLHKYGHMVDRGTADEVAALFHEDAVMLELWESDQPIEGREAIRAWYDNYNKTFRSEVRYLRHKMESPHIEISGNTATSTCFMDADFIVASKNEPIVGVGRYDDEFIKDNGQWWFKKRTVILYYTYPLAGYTEPPPGE